MKYRRKPIVVEAEQFDPEVKPWPAGVQTFLGNRNRFRFFGGAGSLGETICEIRVGDWVVTSPDGARYVMTIFDFYDWYERIPKVR